MKIDKLTFHRRWADILSDLTDSERLEVYDAIVKYGFDDMETSISTLTAQIAFKMICLEIDSERRRKHAIAKARSKAGKLGGRPKQTIQKQDNTESSPKNEPPPFTLDVEDAEIIEEIQADPTTVSSTATNLFGEDITPEAPKKTATRQKKPQKLHYAPEVLMTETEFATLVSKYGKEAAEWCIAKLDDYKAARGMTYKSDYRAILNWVIKEYYKEYDRTSADRQFIQPTTKQQRDYEFASYIADKLGRPDAQK